MEASLNPDGGVIDKTKNPFARQDWIEQRHAFTPHRRDQVELLLSKTIEEIRAIGTNAGSYPAFVAIRWRYAEITQNRLTPTAKWTEWLPPDVRRTPLPQVPVPQPEGTHQAQGRAPRRAVTNSKRYDVMRRDHFQCVLCGASGREAKLEIDHIIPVSQGGTDDPANLRCLCFQCNRGKHAKIETEAQPPPAR